MSVWSRVAEVVKERGKDFVVPVGIAGIVLLAGTSLLAPSRPREAPVTPPVKAEATRASQVGAGDDDYAAQLEQALSETLSAVEGAGSVKVKVFLESGPRYEYAEKRTGETRTTQESDKGGTSRITSEQRQDGEVTVTRTQTGSGEEPVVVVAHLPEVRGVLVVAGGADDPAVRRELVRAVETALGLPAHRVQVMAKEGE